jgi:hypothetical protein
MVGDIGSESAVQNAYAVLSQRGFADILCAFIYIIAQKFIYRHAKKFSYNRQ